MRRPFIDDLAEIRESPTLRVAGLFLALTHPLTYAFFQGQNLPRMLSRTTDAICWPFFESCKELRPLFTEGFIASYLVVYLVLGFLAAALFATRRTTPLAYGLLVATNLVKLGVFVQDYRMMGNYHYMPFLASLAFLLLPDKRRLLRYLLVAFYVGAGTLKLDYEWLSGLAMIRTPIIQGKLLELACAYVVVLELVLVFGLLSRSKRLFWATLAQLAAFHAFSWHIVGFFYPCVMACLLAIVVADRTFAPEAEPVPAPPRWGPVRRSTALALGAFAAAQLAPYFFGGDQAVTGEGRMLALNMFDARSQCHNLMLVHSGADLIEVSRPAERFAVRTRCDPIVYFNWAKNLCDENASTPGFDLDLYLVSKRTTDAAYAPVLSLPGFCTSPVTYDVLTPNPWIHKEP